MKIGQKFNKLTLKEYFLYIDNYKKYTDFNTLGLYRSITENEKLNLEEKIAVREYAHKLLKNSFDFLQLKDPQTFINVSTLGQVMTKGDEQQLWEDIIKNQQKILVDKRIKHRSFGSYSKHNCPYEDCPMRGVMFKQSTKLMECNMIFNSDKGRYSSKEKAGRRKSDRKNLFQLVKSEIE